MKRFLVLCFCFIQAKAFTQDAIEYFVPVHPQKQIFVYEMGLKNTGSIVFLHGGAGDNHKNFLPQCAALAQQWHLYFYDQTNAGKSFSHLPVSINIDAEVELLESLRKTWKLDKLNLLGHSWGSILALCYAARFPDRINKIILTGSIGTDAAYFSLFAQRLQAKFTPKDFSLMQQLQFGQQPQQAIHEGVMLKYYFADTLNIGKMTRTMINFQVNQAIAGDILKQFRREKLRNVENLPILVLQGSHDLLNSNDLQAAFAGFKNIVIKAIDMAGHWIFAEQPDTFFKEVGKFLEIN